MYRVRPSHDHTLGLQKIQKDEGGHELVICDICRKQILGPAYSCSQCDCFLHKRCAELPKEVEDPIHQHLLTRWHDDYFDSSRRLICDVCRAGAVKERYHYYCFTCEFNICISCFMEDRRMITHKSHEHPLALLQRPSSFSCNLCRMEHIDSSYVCVICQFWIHKSCALLPITINRSDHHHPLILELLFNFTKFDPNCYICDERIDRSYWAYYCALCRCSIHVKCSSTSSSTPLRDQESEIMDHKDHDLDVAHLPMNCLVEHLLLDKIEDEPMINHWSHEHHLTLFNVRNDNETNDDNTILCDSCVQPISHPFYCCAQCDYFLHLNCVNLPREIQHPIHQHPIQLSKSSKFFLLTRCDSCQSDNNGFFYKCDTCERFSIDVKCALLPTSIVHEAHKHSLCQNNNTTEVHRCSACEFGFQHHGFICKDCNFRLCYNCALLPKTTKHRWDRHPLILTYPPFFDHPEDFYCEFCDEEINTREWIYHCRKCDQSSHFHCIHRRTYQNVKFGGSREVKDHPHPLKFLQNAMKQFTCCRCGRLSGDDPVLECLECHYMLCIRCM